MKKRKSILIVLMTVLMVMLFSTTAFAAAKPRLSKRSATLKAGKTLTLTLKNAKKSKVKWSSSNKKIATVKKGKVTPKKNGTVKIRAKYKGKTYTCTVKVKGFTKKTSGISTNNPKQLSEKETKAVVKDYFSDSIYSGCDTITMYKTGDDDYWGLAIKPLLRDESGSHYCLINGEKYYYAPILKNGDTRPGDDNSVKYGFLAVVNGKYRIEHYYYPFTSTVNNIEEYNAYGKTTTIEERMQMLDRDVIIIYNAEFVVCGYKVPENTKFSITFNNNGLKTKVNFIAVNRDRLTSPLD